MNKAHAEKFNIISVMFAPIESRAQGGDFQVFYNPHVWNCGWIQHNMVELTHVSVLNIKKFHNCTGLIYVAIVS